MEMIADWLPTAWQGVDSPEIPPPHAASWQNFNTTEEAKELGVGFGFTCQA